LSDACGDPAWQARVVAIMSTSAYSPSGYGTNRVTPTDRDPFRHKRPVLGP